MTDKPLIYTQLNIIVAQVDGLLKDKKNKQQGWSFRGVDDAYNYLHDIFAEHHVFTLPRVINIEREERLTKARGLLLFTVLTMEYDFIADDGSKVTACVIGEAMDTSDKSCNKAMSVAHKMALFQITMLPTLLSADTDEEHLTAMPKIEEQTQQPETPIAIMEQLASLSDFRAEHLTTMEENDYIDGQGSNLTYKQAGQLIERIKARNEKGKE
jgi:hypothetical protein